MLPPQDSDSPPADAENNTPDAPAVRPAPLREPKDKSDMGCLIGLMALFVGVFFLPALFLLGGAPFILPLLFLLICSVLTPAINPAERMGPKPRWIGRILIFLILAGLLGTGFWWYFADHHEALLRE